MTSNDLSDDGLNLVALCSPFGLTPSEIETGLQPLKLSEWNRLSHELERSPLKGLSGLARLESAEIVQQLKVDAGAAEQIQRLLNRVPNLVPALEELCAQGMWVTTRADESYPAKLRATLKEKAPPALFGAGEFSLLSRPAVAIVGSRNIDAAGAAFASLLGRKAVESRLAVASGGARGTDRIGMNAALEAGGVSLGVLADSLEATLRKADVQGLVQDGRLVLLTPYAPNAGFTVGAAMGRNKLIYALSEFAVVVATDYQTGGTWAGAVEALKGKWCPIFVREAADVPPGNRELLKLGAVAMPDSELSGVDNLTEWFRSRGKPTTVEQDLF